jgi:outer membrane protein assembly factor BamB
MTIDQINAPRKPLRLWPGVVAAVLGVVAMVVVPQVMPGAGGIVILGGVVCGLAVIVWWLLFSRAPWLERVATIVLMVVAVVVTSRVVHESISNAMMRRMLPVFSIPILSFALVAAVAASRRFSSGVRRASIVAAILLACGLMTLVRTGGMTGDADLDLHWRWTMTPEERLLAQGGDEPLDSGRGRPAAPAAAPSAPETPKAKDEPTARAAAPAVATSDKRVPVPVDRVDDERTARAADPARATVAAIWPGFRGPGRDGIVRGVRIETDWSRTPPVALWRRPIGPGWSSFAVRGDLAYTQEQRGDVEIVSAYNLKTGKPVWRHRDAARFWESNGGPGPRGTPTVHNGRVYTFGATGIVNALDADNGAILWSRNAAADTGASLPEWGFASSPLVVGDAVIVAASGRLVAYDLATGNPRWSKTTGGGGYSSPHLVTIDGVAQIVLLSGGGATSLSPADGAQLWQHSWQPGIGIAQPALAADRDVLLTAGDGLGGVGMRRIAVARAPAGWTVEERWTSRALKPYFSDFVVHNGHAFGFDGSILACIDLGDGQRKWKGGRYGHGQLVLLPDQDMLLVLSEEGELALVKATPDQFTELARFKAIEGKTWNHPVLVGDILLVRNGEEMAAFRLPRNTP